MSFVTDVLSPGGGVMLLPFVRLVIGCLLVLIMTMFVAGVARLHMAILTVLSSGLLVSLSFFESEYKKARARAEMSSGGGAPPAGTTTTGKGKEANKTD
ncbi:expressed unknown protein [Seminavis robusta]|uniref:Transmembrane protein n=1 Tax=Seminavis robusta TaxID=568900 RepID=A0A9N8H923_9STRA|nr:expressed unknown protein [Seminavis robusta]|eukprot:Sro240_g096050.1 n/a (99) ;mRNA; f:7969-8265